MLVTYITTNTLITRQNPLLVVKHTLENLIFIFITKTAQTGHSLLQEINELTIITQNCIINMVFCNKFTTITNVYKMIIIFKE